jgi:tetratricopeptide (TPR) repeat protein
MQYIEGRSLAQLLAELRRLEGLDQTEPPPADLGDAGRGSPDPAPSTLADGLLSGRFSQAVGPAVPAEPGPDTPSPPPSPAGTTGPTAPAPCPGAEPSSTSSTRSRAYIRTVAQLGVQVAEALDHAHTRGILHSDIKPGNLLLDDQGQLWVTDFGLAQIQGNPALTLTGDVLGTLRYMSPEQALAKRVVIDGRTDTYSLGVTLYELLTLRPAVDGQDRQEILRKIAEEEPPLPRKLNPVVPRDLETIVHKAMAKEPSGRYATARNLADELRRFLEDRSILARRPSLFDRTAKWARRHRAAVWSVGVSLAVLLLMAVAGLATSNVLITRERNQKDGALKQRETALAAAEANLLLARQAVDEMYTQVADELAAQPHMQLFQRRVLEKALRFYQQFARRKSGDPDIQRETAAALLRVGTIQNTLGRHRQARQACEETIAALETLAAAPPADPHRRALQAQACSLHGSILSAQGRGPQAEEAYRRALAFWDELAAVHPDNPQYRSSLAASHLSHAGVLTSRPRETEQALREGVKVYETLVAEGREPTRFRAALGNSYYLLGVFLSRMARLLEAESAFRQAIDILDSSSRLPGRADHWQRATLEFELGQVLARVGRREAAEKAYRGAIAVAERIVSQFPNVPVYRQALVRYLGTLAAFLAEAGRGDEAASFRRSARDLSEQLEAEFEEVSDRLDHLGAAGMHLRDAGDLEAAEWLLRKALTLAAKLAEESSAEPADRRRAMEIHLQLGTVLQRRRRLREAADQFREALFLGEQLAAEFPDDSTHRYCQARQQNYLGIALRTLPNEAATAVQCHQKAIGVCERLVAEFPDQPDYRQELVRSRFSLGIVFRLSGRLAEAVQNFQQAQTDYRPYAGTIDEPSNRLQFASIHNELAWLRATCPDRNGRNPGQAVASARKAVELEPERGGFWNTLGVALYRAADWTEARAALSKSMTLRRGGDAFDWFFLAMAHWQLGGQSEARKWYDQAVQWMEKNRPKDDELRRFRAEAEELLQIKDRVHWETKNGPRLVESRKNGSFGR